MAGEPGGCHCARVGRTHHAHGLQLLCAAATARALEALLRCLRCQHVGVIAFAKGSLVFQQRGAHCREAIVLDGAPFGENVLLSEGRTQKEWQWSLEHILACALDDGDGIVLQIRERKVLRWEQDREGHHVNPRSAQSCL